MENQGKFAQIKGQYWDNLSPENKRKFTVYSIAGGIIIAMVSIVFFLKSGNKKEIVNDIGNPEAKEVKKYNSRTEASRLGADTVNINYMLDQSLGIPKEQPQTQASANNDNIEFVEPDFSDVEAVKRNIKTSQQNIEDEMVEPDYASIRQPMTNLPPEDSEPAPVKKERIKFSDLPEHERKRILLSFGGNGYTETSEISAKFISTGLVAQGQTVSMMSKKDAYLNFKLIPKGTKFSGKVSFSENRMTVNVKSIRVKEEIIPVSLALYSLDGMEGLAVNGDISLKEVKNEAVDEAIAEIPSQAASIIQGALKATRQKKSIKVKLAHDINVLLVNLNSEKYENL